jgi:hypothetical protein
VSWNPQVRNERIALNATVDDYFRTGGYQTEPGWFLTRTESAQELDRSGAYAAIISSWMRS